VSTSQHSKSHNLDQPTVPSAPGAAKMDDQHDYPSIHDRFRDVLTASSNTHVNPSLEHRFPKPATSGFNSTSTPYEGIHAPLTPNTISSAQESVLPDITVPQHQGPSLYTPGFHGIPGQDVPRDQLTPTAPWPRQQHAKLLSNVPRHFYTLPSGAPINATLPDIIAILPHWFRNRNLATRFLNNGINAGLHLALLEEYRYVDVHTIEDRKRARDRLGDAYRRIMRKIDAEWKLGTHVVPEGWDERDLDIAEFVPDGAREVTASISFKDLAIGLKKLPWGNDAGDLTRALEYAIRNRKVDEWGRELEFLFPDDLQAILNQIGRTRVTQEHTDRFVLGRYRSGMRDASWQTAGERKRRNNSEKIEAQPPQQSQGLSYLYEDMFLGSRAYQPQRDNSLRGPLDRYVTYFHCIRTPLDQLPQQLPLEDIFQDAGYDATVSNNFGYGLTFPSLHRTNSQEAAASVAAQLAAQDAEQPMIDSLGFDFFGTDFLDIPSICNLDGELNPHIRVHVPDWTNLSPEESVREMDNLMAAIYDEPNDDFGLTTAETSFDFTELLQGTSSPAGLPTPSPSSPTTANGQLLSHCPEGLDEIDWSDVARASGWARQNPGMGFSTADVGLIVGMMDTMDREGIQASVSAAPDVMEVDDEQPHEIPEELTEELMMGTEREDL
jgi:hypothetical protein